MNGSLDPAGSGAKISAYGRTPTDTGFGPVNQSGEDQ